MGKRSQSIKFTPNNAFGSNERAAILRPGMGVFMIQGYSAHVGATHGSITNNQPRKLLLALLLFFGLPLLGQAYENSECLDCHDGMASERAYSHQPELKVYCVSCHIADDEEYETHLDEPDDNLLNVPRGDAMAAVCANCHQSASSAQALHSEAGLNCNDCHQVHSEEGFNPHFLIKSSIQETCDTCHQEVRTAMAKPFTHPMNEGGMTCASCHDPHGANEGALREERPGEMVCMTCHTDKQGPFVFEHVSDFVGDCRSCHETHGSSNPAHLTRTRVAQLCLECHSMTPDLLGSQPPSRHDLTLPRYQNCTVCHITIHGSNRSPMLLK